MCYYGPNIFTSRAISNSYKSPAAVHVPELTSVFSAEPKGGNER